MRTVEFEQSALIQDGHFVEIGDGVQFVRYGDDGVAGEFLTDDALDQGVRYVVETIRTEGDSLVCVFQDFKHIEIK